MLANRMHKEVQLLATHPPEGVAAWPRIADSSAPSPSPSPSPPSSTSSLQRGASCGGGVVVTTIDASVSGPRESPYEGGTWMVELCVPDRYPIEPPKARFLTKIYHPNIDPEGRICLDLLHSGAKGAWKPSLTLTIILASIRQLLAEPNPDDPLVVEISEEYKYNRVLFDEHAREWTQKYAVPKSPLPATKVIESPATTDITTLSAANCTASTSPSKSKTKHTPPKTLPELRQQSTSPEKPEPSPPTTTSRELPSSSTSKSTPTPEPVIPSPPSIPKKEPNSAHKPNTPTDEPVRPNEEEKPLAGSKRPPPSSQQTLELKNEHKPTPKKVCLPVQLSRSKH
ncbi:ubiquitin-conjugating enzyme E2 T [Pelomyxa schiedti]|nr:ubiquitin-conjugating enzyme E2 T [Pelomyxa schiedti]